MTAASDSRPGLRPLPWQAEVWSRLHASFTQARQAHALLLEGNPGTGRNRFATAFAAFLLCEAASEEGACGACRTCELFAAGSHADFLRLEPVEEGKAIGIDAIRDAIAFVSATASLGSRKVLVVSPLERMTRAAFNAFLKCLEEPPPGTILLLVNALGHPIPPTIRSRCQRWALPEPEPDAATRWLEDVLASDPDHRARIPALLDLAPRRPMTALALAQSDTAENLAALRNALDRLSAGEPAARPADLRALLDACAAGVDIDTFLNAAETYLMAVARSQPVSGLRSPQGQAIFEGLDAIHAMRGARQAGSNPNPDLLRHRAVEALIGSVA